jgi:hypothetical protein
VTLYTQLQAAKTEEDVKDAYIKALGLKGYTKGLIDIQTDEIWFEAKHTGKESSYAIFTQLLHYVQVSAFVRTRFRASVSSKGCPSMDWTILPP